MISYRSRLLKNPLFVLGGVMVICMALAGALSSFVQPVYRAHSRVEFNPDPKSSKVSGTEPSARALFETQAETIKGDGVLRIAAQKLGTASNEELKRAISVEWIDGTRVLDIQAERPRASEAKLWADAVTASYVEFRQAIAVSNSASARQLLNRGIATAQGQIASLNAQIGQKPPNSAELVNQRQQIAAQLSALQDELRAFPETDAVVNGAVNVLSPARTPAAPVRPRTAQNVAIGGMAGVAVGSPLALLARKRRKAEPEIEPLGDHDEEPPFSKAPSAAAAPGRSQESSEAFSIRMQTLDQRLSSLVRQMEESARAGAKLRQSGTAAGVDESIRALEARLEQRLAQQSSAMSEQLRQALEWLVSTLPERVKQNPGQLAEALDQAKAEISSRVVSQGESFSRVTADSLTEVAARLSGLEEGFNSAFGRTDERLKAISGLDAAFAERHRTLEATVNQRHEETLQGLSKLAMRMAEGLDQAKIELSNALGAQQESVGRTLRELISSSEIQDLNKRLERLDHDSLQRLGQLGAHLQRQLQDLKTDFSTGLSSQQEGLEAVVQTVSASLESQVESMASRLNVVVDGAASVFKSEEANLSSLYARTREGILDSLHSESAEMAKRLAALNHELFQRFGRLVLKLSQGLEELRNDVAERMMASQEGVASMLESVEAKLDGDRGLTATVAGLSNQVRSDLEALQARLSTAVERISGGVREGAQANRAELTERLGNVDRENSERLATIGLRLSQALDGLRREVVEKMSAQQSSIASIEQSLESTKNQRASEVISRVNSLKEQLQDRLEAAEMRSRDTLNEIKQMIAEGVRADQHEAARRSAEMESALTRRLEQVSDDLLQTTRELQDSLVKKIAAQQQGVSRKLTAVEAKVEDETSGVSKRLSSRLKAIETALSALDESSKTEAEAAGPPKRITGPAGPKRRPKAPVRPSSVNGSRGRPKTPTRGRTPRLRKEE